MPHVKQLQEHGKTKAIIPAQGKYVVFDGASTVTVYLLSRGQLQSLQSQHGKKIVSVSLAVTNEVTLAAHNLLVSDSEWDVPDSIQCE